MKTLKTLKNLLFLGCVLASGLSPLAEAREGSIVQKARIDPRVIRPNRVAPELYNDELSLKITLMNLPGATTPSSFWEVEYRIYFVAEQDFERTVREMNKAGRGRSFRPEHFQSRILLAEGKFNKRELTSLKDRTFFRQKIGFRSKVPRNQQTSFSSIMSFYAVRVFDGKLKQDVYGSDVFIVPPFENDTNDGNSLLPRHDLFLNFFVSDKGVLFKSNTKSASESTEWNPK